MAEYRARKSSSVTLIHDDKWKQIQQNTFTRWSNQHLKTVGMEIENLETDLSDGVRLIKLAEVLAGCQLPRHNHNPTLRTQKLDNVSMALKFFQVDQGIRLVNIDSAHIVDHNLKLILGLVWTLILHYSISKPIPTPSPKENGLGTKENGTSTILSSTDQNKGADIPANAPTTTNTPTAAATTSAEAKAPTRNKEPTPKQRLMNWIRQQLPGDVPATNFTTDWNDGVALGALLNACVPGACPDWRSWPPNDPLGNTMKAMELAEEWLGVERLIAPEEMVSPAIDEKSMMTYLAQFPQLKGGAERKGRISGVDEFPIAGRRTHFFVDVGDGTELVPEIELLTTGNKGNSAAPPSEMSLNIERCASAPSKYEVSLVPTRVGKLKLSVVLRHKAKGMRIRIGSGPLTMDVMPAPGVTGLSTVDEVPLGQALSFRVTDTREEFQNVAVSVVDGQGVELALEPMERIGNAISYSYVPMVPGNHQIHVSVDKVPVDGSPFPIRAIEEERPTALEAMVWGRGICQEGACAGETLIVHVWDCEEPPRVEVTKGTTSFEVTETLEGENRHGFTYTPKETGLYEVAVKTAQEHHLAQSPYKVRAVGPGLEGGVVGRRSVFFIDTRGDVNKLEFMIEGPTKTELQSTDNGDGSLVVEYIPQAKGRYVLNILNEGYHIRGSPFVFLVEDPTVVEAISLASQTTSTNESALKPRVKVLRRGDFTIGEPVEFIVEKPDPSSSTQSQFNTAIYGPDLSMVDHQSIEAQETSTGWSYFFIPKREGRYLVWVVDGDGAGIDGCPAVIHVKRDIASIESVPPVVRRKEEEAFNGNVTEKRISTTEGDVPLPPKREFFHTEGKRKASIKGDNTIVGYAGVPASFMVRAEEQGELAVRVSGAHRVELSIDSEGNGDFRVNYCAREPGEYRFLVMFDDENIEGSPMEVLIKESSTPERNEVVAGPSAINIDSPLGSNGDATRVSVDGPGLMRFEPGVPASFFVNTGETGANLLYIAILTGTGPAEEVHVSHLGNGVYEVNYRVPEQAQKAWVFVKYGENCVQDSPFIARAVDT